MRSSPVRATFWALEQVSCSKTGSGTSDLFQGNAYFACWSNILGLGTSELFQDRSWNNSLVPRPKMLLQQAKYAFPWNRSLVPDPVLEQLTCSKAQNVALTGELRIFLEQITCSKPGPGTSDLCSRTRLRVSSLHLFPWVAGLRVSSLHFFRPEGRNGSAHCSLDWKVFGVGIGIPPHSPTGPLRGFPLTRNEDFLFVPGERSSRWL